jgi:hypothetical protein
MRRQIYLRINGVIDHVAFAVQARRRLKKQWGIWREGSRRTLPGSRTGNPVAPEAQAATAHLDQARAVSHQLLALTLIFNLKVATVTVIILITVYPSGGSYESMGFDLGYFYPGSWAGRLR